VVNGQPQYLPSIPNDPTCGPLAGAPFNQCFGLMQFLAIIQEICIYSYDLTSKLSLTAGLRGTWENANAGYQVQDAYSF
jgi:hypothetical protein